MTMRLYNLFPTLAGSFDQWTAHLERAADMGFNWIFVNPVQHPGRSGSLYSIRDYFRVNPVLLNPMDGSDPETQFSRMAEVARSLGLRLMVDLVINHCAADAPVVREHPEWFVHEGNGRVAHPYCVSDGKKVVWRDLARFDHQHTRDPEGLYEFFHKVVEFLVGLGFEGFRCDAAYQLPASLWTRLIADVRANHPEVVFTAETLGCSPGKTRATAEAGFDFIFNSSKWWDFSSPWLLEQYALVRHAAPSISFPESHDTPRLYEEGQANLEMMKQRYLFAATFSAGVMIPMGFEFGHRKPLHVVKTRPSDWEEGEIDLTGFIRETNRIKASQAVFQEDGPLEILNHENPAILVMWQATGDGRQEALVILNKDPWHHQHFHVPNLSHLLQHQGQLLDRSPEYRLDFLPSPFTYDLRPGQGFIFLPAEQA